MRSVLRRQCCIARYKKLYGLDLIRFIKQLDEIVGSKLGASEVELVLEIRAKNQQGFDASTRSSSASCGRLLRRCSTPSWCRRTMISRSFERPLRTASRTSNARNR